MRQRVVPHHPCHKEWRKAAQDYGRAILEAKQKQWTDYLKEASAKDLWMVNQYLKELVGNKGKSHIPTLKIKKEDGTV